MISLIMPFYGRCVIGRHRPTFLEGNLVFLPLHFLISEASLRHLKQAAQSSLSDASSSHLSEGIAVTLDFRTHAALCVTLDGQAIAMAEQPNNARLVQRLRQLGHTVPDGLTLLPQNTIIWLFLFGILGFCAYITATHPAHVVVSEYGEISGTINNIRATLQGQRFWQNQIQVIEAEIEQLERLPQREEKLNLLIEKAIGEFDERMAKLYEERPDMRPSSASQQAEALRDEADRIENEEFDQLREKSRLERLHKLQKTLEVLISKV